MIPLPFADDLRARPEKVPKAMQLCKPGQSLRTLRLTLSSLNVHCTGNSEQVDAMSVVLKKLRLKQSTYEPRAYPNPGKQQRQSLDCTLLRSGIVNRSQLLFRPASGACI